MAIATYWVSPASPMPDDLAGQQLARRGGADHQLHDPAALLGGDAGRDPHPVDDDGDEQQDDEDDAQERRDWPAPAGSTGWPPSVGDVDRLERRRSGSGTDRAGRRRAASDVQSRMPMAIAAKPTSWLRDAVAGPVGPVADVELAVGRPLDDQDAADLAGREARVGRCGIGRRARSRNGFSQVAGSAPVRRDVEQAVGDADGRRARARSSLGHDRDPGDGLAVEVADGDRRQRDAQGEAHQDDRRGQEQRAARPVAVLAPGDDRRRWAGAGRGGPSGRALDDRQVGRWRRRRPGWRRRRRPAGRRAR